MVTATETNTILSAYLDEAGWSPRVLAREINKLFGAGTVSDTAPYYWRDKGGVPRHPLPALTAYVLSRRLGHPVEVRRLWQGAVSDSAAVTLATNGIELPWTMDSTVRVAQDWVMAGLTDRRVFLAVSGAALARAVWAYLTREAPLGQLSAAVPAGGDSPLLAQIEQSIPLLQRLDDAKGGAANLSYVGAQVRAVSLVLAEGGHSAATTRRLLVALAELAQLAGWMAFDADRHGLAQRYLFTALRASHDAGYTAMAGHVLADLSVQATTLDQSEDAVVLGEAATRAAAKTTSSVRASITSRLAHAYAGANRVREFHRARGQALDLLDKRNLEHDPEWMYYLTPNHLDCQAGYSLILAGRRQRGAGDTSGGNRLIRDGQRLLRTGAHQVPLDHASQRRALYEGAWLSLGYATRGQLEAACDAGRVAITRLNHVRSPRSVDLLRQLATDLNKRKRNQAVGEFVPDLYAALTQHSA
ncbi:MAG: carph-isopro domain-containing protein [Micromonosporaceae bacterium]